MESRLIKGQKDHRSECSLGANRHPHPLPQAPFARSPPRRLALIRSKVFRQTEVKGTLQLMLEQSDVPFFACNNKHNKRAKNRKKSFLCDADVLMRMIKAVKKQVVFCNKVNIISKQRQSFKLRKLRHHTADSHEAPDLTRMPLGASSLVLCSFLVAVWF